MRTAISPCMCFSGRPHERGAARRSVRASGVDSWREQVRSFTELGAAHMGGVNLTDDNQLDNVESAHVTPSAFRVVGTRPLLGRNLIDDMPVTVVGVQAAARWFPWPWIQIITPLRFDPAKVSRTDHYLTVYGRLPDRVTIQEAQAEMDVIAAAVALEHGDPQ